MNNQNFWKLGARIGVFFAILFVICFAWYYIRGGSTELLKLHENLLALSYFGWSGVNFTSFILGLIQTFIWGYVALALWNLSGIFFKRSQKNN